MCRISERSLPGTSQRPQRYKLILIEPNRELVGSGYAVGRDLGFSESFTF